MAMNRGGQGRRVVRCESSTTRPCDIGCVGEGATLSLLAGLDRIVCKGLAVPDRVESMRRSNSWSMNRTDHFLDSDSSIALTHVVTSGSRIPSQRLPGPIIR